MEEIFNRKITFDDIKKINELKPKFISVRSTKFLDYRILQQLDNSIRIRVIGEDDEKSSQEKVRVESGVAEYSKDEMMQIVTRYHDYEDGIHKDWSDLHKALYLYSRMIMEYSVATQNERTQDSSSLKSFYTFNPDSKGLAKNYKELMDRIGIPCRYLENVEGTSAWNEIMIDGVYYPVDISMDSKASHEKGPGTILVHNFGKNVEFYEYPEHKQDKQAPSKPANILDKEKVQQALNIVVDQIGADQLKNYERARENIKIELHSKELKGAFEGDTVSLDTLKELKPLKITVQDSDFGQLISELKTVAVYYPEILRNVEIENTSSKPVDMQAVVDGIYEAKSVGTDLVVDPISVTVASKFEEDFNLDLSKVPQVADTTTRKLNDTQRQQQIIFRNTDASKKLKAPVFTNRVSNNLSAMSFEGFDLSGLDLTTTGLKRLSFNNSTNLDKVNVDRNVSFAVELEAVTPAELNSALTNFTIHDLTIDTVDLHNRAILQELSTNPELVKISIHNARLNNLDGLESFDNRLFLLNLQRNELGVSDIERVQNFKRTNPYLEYYLSSNIRINDAINALPEISDETYDFLKDYRDRTREKFRIDSKSKAINYLLWEHSSLPYYIKDARTIRDGLKITINPMMVENNAQLDTFDFNQSYLRDGTLYLTPSQVEHLISTGKSVPQNIRLKIESTADLSADYANDLARRANALGMHITEVQIYDASRHNNFNQIAPYTLSQYAYIRDTLDVIVDGILPSDSDIDKFATIYQRLMDNITYDYDCTREGNATEARYYAEKRDSSRNLLQGLEEGKCVCSGYADILRNALMMVGLNVENVSGFTSYNSRGEEDGFHSWNMVELDDGYGTKRWYNTDLTWSAGQTPAQVENVTLRGDVSSFTSNHMPWSTGLPTASATDFDRHLLRAAFARARTKSFNVKDKIGQIDIPEDPTLNIEILDRDRILQEYNRRKDDMCAKYYGDKDYRKEYIERSRRFRSHEIEENAGAITFRKIEDYPEREEDEQFLLLDKYSECLERMTKYEAGDTSVYTGTADQIAQALAKDKEYVETRNHTFNKNKDVRANLATLGKFGERVPYIPPQTGVLKNVGRVALNSGIFVRNLVSPIYRGVGRYVAQPIHRLVIRDRDASPFRNNWYHRMVARRDYFTESNNNNTPGHPIRNGIKARVDAIFKAKEGNKAVLNAGASEIQANIVAQERERNMLHSLTAQSSSFEAQIQNLQMRINSNPLASNIEDAKNALREKINKKAVIDNQIARLSKNRTGISQTDAISDAQHDIAVKEEVTMKTTVIKGFAKGLAVRYVGPKIHEWLSKRGTETVTEQVTTTVPVEKQKWIEPKYRTETTPIYEEVTDTGKTMSEMMDANAGKTVTGFYSVYGGERGPASYTLTGDENITAIFQVKGNGGTGLSDVVGLKAPTLVNGTFSADMLTSNGLLNQDITIEQLLEAVNNGTIDANAISDMYVSVGDRYWTKLSDLTSGLVSKVQTGSELKRVIDIPGHYESYIDYIDKVNNVTHTVPTGGFSRLANISRGALYTGAGIDSVLDLEENLRFSNTDVPENKAIPKDYRFTGPDEMPTSRREYHRQRERD